MKKSISIIIFWGAVWGLIEATLGYVLHSFSLSVGWFFWFPLAFYFMSKVYRQTNSVTSVLFASAIAAAIKLIDFLLPARIDRIINPAVSIIFEGLIVFAAFKIIEHKQDFFRIRYLEAFAVSIGWRVLYVVYILLMPAFFYSVSPMRAASPFMKFFLLESIANSLIIYAYMKITERTNERKVKAGYIKDNKFKQLIAFVDTNTVLRSCLSLFMLALAFYVQWVL